ncbi:Phenol hydroxylase P1 protein [compost metagenome]
MLTEFMRLWFAESQRWVDALVKTAVAERAENRELIEGWLVDWRVRALQALAPLADIGPGRASLDAIDSAFGARLAKLGLSGAAA